ncbi:packaging protein [Marine gokushovirus]|nr:packaging protein [Marine gokushovirus]
MRKPKPICNRFFPRRSVLASALSPTRPGIQTRCFASIRPTFIFNASGSSTTKTAI